ncbi:MAG TPA: aldolase/citrate lyase family protein [Conexibacter sp.]|nr:aldolase/citrate lyase family protein [Conexibacter sp.]
MSDASAPAPLLAERVRAGERLLGLIVKLPAPAVVEIAGHSGFDLVAIDTEHGLADGVALHHHLRSAAAAGLGALVRVGGPETPEILRALDAGADGVIVPHVTTGAQAQAVVSAARYPPEGRRGFALSTPAAGYGSRTVAEHFADARRRTLVAVQLEDAEAVPNAAGILATPGVDVAFVGTADLAASLGHPGEVDHPDVQAAIDAFVTAAREQGTPLCGVAADEAGAAAWFAAGGQITLFEASLVLAARLRGLAAGARSR